MPVQTSPRQQAGPRAAAPQPLSGDRGAVAGGGGGLLERTRTMIRSVGRQLAARRGNLDRLNGKR